MKILEIPRVEKKSVLVNYAEPEAIAKAIEAIRLGPANQPMYFPTYFGIPPEQIPLVGSGQALRAVYEVSFDRVVDVHDLPQALLGKGRELGIGELAFADPLTTLRFCAETLGCVRDCPLVTNFFDVGGQLWSLVIGQVVRDGKVGARYLCVDRVEPDDAEMDEYDPERGWEEDTSFLAVVR